MYERITIRHPHLYEDFITINETKQLPDTEQSRKVLNRLCDLEDKIEQGKLLELQCKVGDTIWEVWAGGSDITEIQRGVRAIKVDLIYINQYDTILHCVSQEMTGHIPLSDFGKIVFLDRAAAEAKVREMEGADNEKTDK